MPDEKQDETTDDKPNDRPNDKPEADVPFRFYDNREKYLF
jgi:hypothetical protein